MTVVTPTRVPAQSRLSPTLADANFFDAYTMPLTDTSLSPAAIFLRAATATPRWVRTLLAFRNAAVRLVGLKGVGSMRRETGKPAHAYLVGDRIGIFDIYSLDDTEMVMGLDDHHLDVRLSVMKIEENGAPHAVISTVVHVHNRLGSLYMLPVGRIHPLVTRAMMRGAQA